MGKLPQSYEDICNKTFFYEQKPIKINEFNETKEKEVNEHVQKRKKIKFIKKKKKREENKKTEKEIWDRLKDLNQEFKDIKEYKKKS